MPIFFEEIRVGDVWISDAYPVTREEMIGFASRWDPKPFHIDDEAAAKPIFSKLTASLITSE